MWLLVYLIVYFFVGIIIDDFFKGYFVFKLVNICEIWVLYGLVIVI